MIDDNNPIAPICLERNGKTLIYNPEFPRPLVVTKGGDYIRSFISAPSAEKDPALYDILFKHNLIGNRERRLEVTDKFDVSGKDSLAIYLLVSQECNLSCTYCLAGTGSYRQHKMMSQDIAFRTLERAAGSIKPGGNLEVVFFGGEPLLNWQLVKGCIDHINANLKKKYPDVKITVNMTSNMTILPSDFVAIAKSNRLSLLVDIDGPQKLHDSVRKYINGKPTYDQVLKNLSVLAESGIPFQMRATIIRSNVNDILNIVKLHKKIGASSSGLPALVPVNSDGHEISASLYPDIGAYQKGIREALNADIFDIFDFFPPNVYAQRIIRGRLVSYGCGLGYGRTAVVTSAGDVFPCIYLVGNKAFFLGNTDEEEIFSQRRFEERFRRLYLDLLDVRKMNRCNNCEVRYLCGGGCPIRILGFLSPSAKAHEAYGYFHDISCCLAKTSIEESLWYFADHIDQRPPSLSVGSSLLNI